MKKIWTAVVCVSILSSVFVSTLKADDSTGDSTITDLTNRVVALEAAVARIQQQCAGMSDKRQGAVAKSAQTWICKAAGRKDIYYGVGETRALAEKNAAEKCRRQSPDGFCKPAECSQ